MEKIPIGDKSGIRRLEDVAVESEIEGGAYLNRLPVGSALEVETENHIYTIEKRDDGYYIDGHPEFCPEPTKVVINGSTMGGSAIRLKFVGRGMKLEFVHPKYGTITTSWIRDVKEVKIQHGKGTPGSGSK